MTQELLYTSAPRGLLPGSQGFCTVAATRSLTPAWREVLEGLSGYRPLFAPDDPRNPVAFAHWRVTAGGVARSVLSRVGPAGLDYTGRTNKLAHHLVLDAGERPAAGPAWLLSRPGLFQSTWDGEVAWRPFGPPLPDGAALSPPCRAWEHVTGDAGWSGVLAETFSRESHRPAVLVYKPDTDLLTLIGESLLLLSPARRWDVTFTTYFTALPPAAECLWRGVVAGTPEAKAAVRLPGAFVLDLTASLGRATGGPLVETARTGRRPVASEVGAASRAAPDSPARLAGPTPAGPPRAPWPGATPPPPPAPLRFGPPGSRFDEPRRSRLAVWLVLLAMLVGGAGVAGVVALRPWEISVEKPVAARLPDDRNPNPKAPIGVREAGVQAGVGFGTFVSTRRKDLMRQVAIRPTPQNEPVPENPNHKPAEEVWKPKDEPNRVVKPPTQKPRSEKPATLAQVRLVDYFTGNASAGVLLDVRRRFNIARTTNLSMRLFVPKPDLIRPVPADPAPAVTVVATKKGVQGEQLFSREFVRFHMEDGNLRFELMDDLRRERNHWRALIDSVVEISDQAGHKWHVALRDVVSGTYEWKDPQKLGDDWPVLLRWSDYAGWEPTLDIRIQRVEIQRTVKIKEKYKNKDGKEEVREVELQVTEGLPEISANGLQAKTASSHDNTVITARLLSPTQLVFSSSKEPVIRDAIKPVRLELIRVLDGVGNIPVFRLGQFPPAASAAKMRAEFP
jgi:hypothetical protein